MFIEDTIRWTLEKIFRLILKFTPTIVLPPGGATGIATIVHHDHVQLITIALKSFFYYSGVILPVFLVDDGSLTRKDYVLLQSNFKNILIKHRARAAKEIVRILKGYPYCLRYRKEKNMEFRIHNKKLFDPILLSPFTKVILLDADVIFFNVPKEILNWIYTNEAADLHMSYDKTYMDKEKHWGVLGTKILAKIWDSPLTLYFNSGLYCVTKKNIILKHYEKYLKRFYLMNIQDELIGDQFFQSMNISENLKQRPSYRIRTLPSDLYVVLVDMETRKKLFQNICVHYHAELKRFFPGDAIALLQRTYFFRAKKESA